MNREQLKTEANKVQKIVASEKLILNGKELDISEYLRLHQSKEYRKEDIKAIDIAKFEKSTEECKYTITADGSDSVVFNSKFKDKKMCILNFASSKNPGGGFTNGAMAQEEALCQASNLYSILSEHHDFYEYNENHLNRSLYSDGLIFTRDCVFFRNKYKNTNPVLVDIITCPAPNFNAAKQKGVKTTEIESTMRRRLEQILKVAIDNNVRVLALGAFGCGVFGNEPSFVAYETKTLLEARHYKEYFTDIIFPMNAGTGPNVAAFLKEFKPLI